MSTVREPTTTEESKHVCTTWTADSFCVECGLLPVDGNPGQPSGNNLLACPGCSLEMWTPDENLPLHMAKGRVCIGSGTPGEPPKLGEQIKEPLTIPAVAELSLSEVFAADTCLACGGPKNAGQPLCTTDHGLLPFVMRMALPPYMKHYLYADEKKDLTGADEQKRIVSHYTKRDFMELFQSCLTKLAEIRANGPVVSDSESTKGTFT